MVKQEPATYMGERGSRPKRPRLSHTAASGIGQTQRAINGEVSPYGATWGFRGHPPYASPAYLSVNEKRPTTGQCQQSSVEKRRMEWGDVTSPWSILREFVLGCAK